MQTPTDRAMGLMEKRVTHIYKQAEKDIAKKLKDFTSKFKEKDKQYREKLKNGEITKDEYDRWKQSQVFVGERWQEMKEDISYQLLHADTIASRLLNDEKRALFQHAANSAKMDIGYGTRTGTNMTMYDSAAVTRILKEKPKLLPDIKPKNSSVKRWNSRMVGDAVAQSIIQGESLENAAKRISIATGEASRKVMMRTARTAMTGAQNAGRIEAMRDASDMGIKVKKKWIATLDSRTRDTHAELDGQEVGIDEPFTVNGMQIMYPGDPQADPSLVYNCRCSLLWVYPEYDSFGKRRDNETGEQISEMDYIEWAAAKEKGKLPEFSDKKEALSDVSKVIFLNDGEHVFKGIWKNDITYADYEAKKGTITAKRAYFYDQLNKANAAGDKVKAYEIQAKLYELDRFESDGAYMSDMLKLRNQFSQEVRDMRADLLKDKIPAQSGQFSADSWDANVKAMAKSFSDRSDADSYHRSRLDKEWANLEDREKYATWEYTRNSNPMNKSLSGYHERWDRSDYLGPLNTEWGHEDRYRTIDTKAFKQFEVNGHVSYKEAITNLTLGIDKCSFEDGVQLVRGSGKSGFAGMIEGKVFTFDQASAILNSDINTMRSALIGQEVQNHAFTSTGIARGTGFSGEVMFEIYAPKGTHGIYAEPQSYFGMTASRKMYSPGMNYHGVGYEAEIILQRGTTYRITDIEKIGSTIHVKMDVVAQPGYFKFGDENTADDGATRHLR